MTTRLNRQGTTGDVELGAWKPIRASRDPGAPLSAHIRCPGCGRLAVLLKHRISDAGVVDPSFVCPVPPCQFHDYLVLADWRGG